MKLNTYLFTIKGKLISAIVAFILLIASLVGFSIFSWNRIERASLNKDYITSIAEGVSEARIDEKAYLQYYDEKLVLLKRFDTFQMWIKFSGNAEGA